MKKLISLITVFSMLILALVSCGEQTVPSESVASPQTAAPTGEPIMSDEPITTGSTPSHSATESTGTPEENTTGNGTTEQNDGTFSGYPLKANAGNRNFVETPSKIIFLGIGTVQGGGSKVYYYSKADGEFYPFCFDPLCQHQDLWDGEKYVGTTCVAKMLYWNNGTRTNANTPPQYCNGRIYFVYFDEIWSCNEYATDIRIDASFSKLPSDITRTEARNRINSGLSCFQQFMVGGNSVFFDHLDADGEVRYYRLDTETRKLHDLTEEMEELAIELGLESLIFQYAVGHYIRFVGLNTETKKAEYITTDQNLNQTSIPFLGEYDSLTVLRNTASGQLCGIRRFDEEHNLLSSVYVEVLPDGEYRSLDVGENGIYVTKNHTYGTGGESVKLGYGRTSSVTGKSEEVINHNNGIARYDKETGEKELLFQDDWLNLDTIFYINENTGDFIASMTKYKQNTGGIISSGSGIIYTGKLVDGKLANFEEAIAPDAIFVEPPYDIPG